MLESPAGGDIEYLDAEDFWSTKIASKTHVAEKITKAKTETLELLIKKHNPTIIQMDIEGLDMKFCVVKRFWRCNPYSIRNTRY